MKWPESTASVRASGSRAASAGESVRGAIWVAVRAAGAHAIVAVRDEGIGIPQSDLPMLFRPFGRASHPAARNIQGFGLGLFICRDIVERHGGSIAVDSRLNAGTTFTVTLPRTPEATLAHESPMDDAHPSA